MNYSNSIAIGIAFLNNERHERAITYLTKAITEDFENFDNELLSEAYENRALSFYHLHKYENALNDWQKSIELNSTNENVFFNRAKYYLQIKDKEQALKDFNSAYLINNQNLQTILNISYINLLNKNYNIVLEFLEKHKFYLIEENNVYYFWYIAIAHLELKNYKKAIEFNLKALQCYSLKKEFLYNNIGFSYLKLNKLDLANEYFLNAIDIDPQFSYSINNRGFIKYLNKNYERALELINESLDFNPSNSFAYKNRAIVNLAIGNIEEAFQDLLFAKKLYYHDDYDEEVDELLQNNFSDRI